MINSRVLDNGLNFLVLHTTSLHICPTMPAGYGDIAGTSIGVKQFPVLSGPKNWVPGGTLVEGRRVTITTFTDGVVTADGNAVFWVLVDDKNHYLFAANALYLPKTFVAGNSFSLEDFDIVIPSDASVA